MEGHLEYKDNRVVISDELRKKPSFFKLYNSDKSQNKKVFYDFITYLYFVYSTTSIYKRHFLEERKAIVLEDKLELPAEEIEPTIMKYEDSKGMFYYIIEDYIQLTKTPEEKLLDAVVKKIEEYVTFANTQKINLKNHTSVLSLIKGSNELLEFKEKVQQQVYKTGTKREQGNARKTFIEEKLNKKIIE